MISISKENFFNQYRIRLGKLSQSQAEGLDFLLDKLMGSKRIDTLPKSAYVLATTAWETSYTFQPVTEYGSQKYLRSKKYYPYIGRGYCQLTWKDNYQKFGQALGIDLVNNPDLAKEPETAWKIMEMGMTDNFGVQDPGFTIYSLEDFFTNDKSDFVDARKIINPKDYESYQPIAELAKGFLECLEASVLTRKIINGLA